MKMNQLLVIMLLTVMLPVMSFKNLDKTGMVSSTEYSVRQTFYYYYGFAYSYEKKILYVTNLFPVDSDEYKVGVENQWSSKFKAFRGKDYYEFTEGCAYGFTKAKATIKLNEYIAEFKKEDFDVKYINFSYVTDKL